MNRNRLLCPAAQNNYGAFLCRQKHYQLGLNYLLKAAHNPNYTHANMALINAKKCRR
ncbi:MAG: hypothetical protein K0U12_01810 [Gammaproteobacteria bacterium]|nr:hypothetical protein [Gammaproteobacteria bacterium]